MTAALDLKKITIPFRNVFRHAAAQRSETESVWVEARSRGGAVGYGEACPRGYVTGEDVASVATFLFAHRASLCAQLVEIGDLIAWAAMHRAEIDRSPAAWCAIELAWLDALAQERAMSVEALLGLDEIHGTFRYSAVIGVEDDTIYRATVQRYTAAGFSDFKIKLSGDSNRDRAQLAWFQAHVPAGWRLRLDANNLWATGREAATYLEQLDCPFLAIEEPLRPAGRYGDLAALAATLHTRIILDESCRRPTQLHALAPRPRGLTHGATGGPSSPWVINVRVSKMGGVLRSLEVVDAARRRGIPIVVGAQVGETSLLTRAALTVASQAQDILLAQEGAFGTLLLTTDVCDPPLMFGRGGLIEFSAPSGPGFGLCVRRDLPFITPLSASC